VRSRFAAACLIVAVSAVAAAVLAPAGGAARPLQGPEEEAVIYLGGPRSHSKEVVLRVYAQQGVAVLSVSTFLREGRDESSVSYATRIARGPLDRRIDVRIPGVGHAVGRLVGPGAGGGCDETQEGHEAVYFVGDFDFHGSGGDGPWRARRAPVEFRREGGCGAPARKARKLGEYLDEAGPQFYANNGGPLSVIRTLKESKTRATELFAETYGEGPEETVAFTAIDYERLGHGVHCDRWVARRSLPRRDLFDIAPGGRLPKSATVTPPAPFSGEATYSRKGHTFLGDLSVEFPGLTLRLAGKGAEAFVANVL
jgi:hypothetical protein